MKTLAALAAAVLGTIGAQGARGAAPEATGTSRYFVDFVARRGRLNDVIILSGRVEPAVSRQVTTEWGAVVAKILVSPGQAVKKGEVLANLDQGYLMTSSELLESSIQLAKAKLGSAQIEAQFLHQKGERTKTLVAKGIAPAAQLEQLEADDLRAQVASVNVEKVLVGLTAQRAQMREQMRVANFVAPIDGVVTSLIVDPRQVVGSLRLSSGAVFAKIEQPGEFVVRTEASDAAVAAIDKKMGCVVELASDLSIPCTVESIASMPSLSDEARKQGGGRAPADGMISYEVRARFTAKATNVPTGYLTNVVLSRKGAADNVVVPWNAVEFRGVQPFVHVVDAKTGQTGARAVKLGRRDKTRVEVLDQINDGDLVRAFAW